MVPTFNQPNATEHDILLSMINHYSENGFLPNNETLAAECQISVEAFVDHINQLRVNGYLQNYELTDRAWEFLGLPPIVLNEDTQVVPLIFSERPTSPSIPMQAEPDITGLRNTHSRPN